MAPALVRSDQRRRELHASLAVASDDGVLPSDVLYDILLRLPANVLCRLRLVCRSWRSLTTDPIFARAHFSRHPLIVGLHHVTGGLPELCRREVQFVDLSGNIIKRICIMMGQGLDNGYRVSTQPCLVCTSSMKKACVLNPSTGGFTVLPAGIAARHKNKGTPILSYSLLGRIPSTGEYKVLRIHQYTYDEPEPEQTCEVMTVGDRSSDGRWTVRASPPVCVALTSLHGVVVNGMAYFMLEMDMSNTRSGKIASFDLAIEEWRPDMLRGPLGGLLPVDDNENMVRFYLAEMNRCLVTICHYYNCGRDRRIDLWFSMDIDKGLWTKLYSLPGTLTLPYHGLISPLKVLNDGRLLVWVRSSARMKVYDPKTNTSADVPKLNSFFGVCMYQGNLLC